MWTIILRAVEVFRFIRRYRERADQREAFARAERDAERQHQRLVLETIFSKMLDAQRVQNEGLMALAQAQAAQAAVLQEWLKSFHIQDPSPQPPVVIRPEDEFVGELNRLRGMGIPVDDPEFMTQIDLPPEFRLAYELNRSAGPSLDVERLNQSSLEAEGFDREV